MDDALGRFSRMRDAMGPEECKVALWIGLIGMWTCGYVIETRPQRAPASTTPRRPREQPYPVRSQHLYCLRNALGGTSVLARTYLS